MGDIQPLRRGWTTGACATAAAKAAFEVLCGFGEPRQVQITLPRGQRPTFVLSQIDSGVGWARAAVVKDAGDDPDVTHGVTVIATVRPGEIGSGVTFLAGAGVGTVTKPGLALGVGEPAINPAPRKMISYAISEVAEKAKCAADVSVEISVPGGEEISRKTWNPRLGIVGGLSILGTTGIVVPYSCSAWIHSIYRGVDVARATGETHVAGCTGSTSEEAVRKLFGLPEGAMLDMGDFAGGLLKYIKRHRVPRLTIGGGFAKISKLAVGALDLHSARSQVDIGWLSQRLAEAGAVARLVEEASRAETAAQVLELSGDLKKKLAEIVAIRAREVAMAELARQDIEVDVVVVDREGEVLAVADGGSA